MGARIDLTLDAGDVAVLAAFWKTALGYEDEPPPAPFATRDEWLASFGIDPEDSANDGAWLCDPDGVGPRLSILRVPEPKTAKNRLHMDIRVPGGPAAVEAEAARLVAAGARRLWQDDDHCTLGDPEGNEFCVAPVRVFT
ncbi:VOC family protein [Streptomyces sp. NRRL F-5123]|uniref:VOC family protein n=1 Tax=Streptomyces sp. NRRL F-5123 TaxID=1463856 RepID=UPI0004E21D43|nr:VOC family protein [Streptomyces sp. NRRL F-5123]